MPRMPADKVDKKDAIQSTSQHSSQLKPKCLEYQLAIDRCTLSSQVTIVAEGKEELSVAEVVERDSLDPDNSMMLLDCPPPAVLKPEQPNPKAEGCMIS
jgi:hypothetical protein